MDLARDSDINIPQINSVLMTKVLALVKVTHLQDFCVYY